jgi:hypothetical protein
VAWISQAADVNVLDLTEGSATFRRFPQPMPLDVLAMKLWIHLPTGKVAAAVSTLEWTDAAPLDARYRELDVKWRTIDESLLSWARETEAAAPRIGDKAVLPLAYAGRVQRLAKASPETKLPVQILKIGDVCIGTTPVETFAETGIEFRERSPFAKSFMIELANGYYGYMPTPRHFELGGYETWPGTNNIEPQASVKVMDALLEMAAEVK